MHRAALQSISDSTPTFIHYDTVDYDPGADITLGSSWTYTVPVNGIYATTAFCTFATFTGRVYIELWKNGASYSGPIANDRPSSSSAECSVADQLSCVAGDTLSVVAFQNSGGGLNIGPATFSVHFLSPT